jgi:hypothetical protein
MYSKHFANFAQEREKKQQRSWCFAQCEALRAINVRGAFQCVNEASGVVSGSFFHIPWWKRDCRCSGNELQLPHKNIFEKKEKV